MGGAGGVRVGDAEVRRAEQAAPVAAAALPFRELAATDPGLASVILHLHRMAEPRDPGAPEPVGLLRSMRGD